MDPTSFISFEDDLLHFHRIEDLVGLHSSRERHDIVSHESGFSLAKIEVKHACFHRSFPENDAEIYPSKC